MRFLKGLRKFAGRAGREQSGTTAIEFAMVIGPFLGLLFAIMETALVYFAQFSIDAAVHNAARVIRLGSAQKAGFSQNQFKQVVCKDLPAFIPCSSDVIVDVRSFDTFSQAAQNMPNPIRSDGTLDKAPGAFNMGGPAKVVVVTVYYDWHLFTSLPGLGDFTGKLGLGLGNLPDGSRLIQSTTAFRTETYS